MTLAAQTFGSPRISINPPKSYVALRRVRFLRVLSCHFRKNTVGFLRMQQEHADLLAYRP
jgi:hypothetical protein